MSTNIARQSESANLIGKVMKHRVCVGASVFEIIQSENYICSGTNSTCPRAIFFFFFLKQTNRRRSTCRAFTSPCCCCAHTCTETSQFSTLNACFWFLVFFLGWGGAQSCLPPHTTDLSCRRGERCEPHQARLSQSEPLIITSQYQLQQPCTDAKTLGGLATLPYLI